MKITDIRQQAKRQDRYSIYVEGAYVFSFSESALLSSGIRIGRDYDPNELAQLQTQAVFDKAYDQAQGLIYRRPRSQWELQDYLKRKDYTPEIINQTIEKLTERGYVNDHEFARRWVENRRLLKATSKRRLMQELRQKRIADDIIHDVLSEDTTDERALLVELVERKRRQTKYQDDSKLMQYLSRQGYNYEDIKAALQAAD